MIHSAISNKPIHPEIAIQGKDIRSGIYLSIANDHPDFTPEKYISLDELNFYRKVYLTKLVEQEKGELAMIDMEVLKAIKENSILSENIQDDKESQLTFGEKISDKIAGFGGSWTFIISFFTFILGWIFINIWILKHRSFDPYPFILLNLILSCIAAIQAPIIMMSQNRQEQKDRMRAEHDYKINLKAELEIKLLSEKIDHLLVHQSKKLLEIQQVQADYLEDILNHMKQQNK